MLPATNTNGDLQARRPRYASVVRRVCNLGWWVVLASAGVQLSIDTSIENLVCTGSVLLSYALVSTLVLREEAFQTVPLSTLAVLGFAGIHQIIPLIFISLEGRPLIYNLVLPQETFLWSLTCLAFLVFAHAWYRTSPLMSRTRDWLRYRVCGPVGLHTPPSLKQVWLMGFVGLAAIFFIYYLSKDVGRETTGVGDKLIAGLIPFAYAPFLLLTPRVYGGRQITHQQTAYVVLFFLMVLAVSLGRNGRSSFMNALIAPVLATFLGVMIGSLPGNLFSAKRMVFAAIAVYLAVGPLSDLATAMVIARSGRDARTATDTALLTLRIFQDKELLRQRREEDAQVGEAWDESHISNVFVGRVCNTKRQDNCLQLAGRLGEEGRRNMRQHEMNRLLATLPAPLIRMLGIDFDKQIATSYSIGDALYYEVTGLRQALGGFRTGHFIATGVASFGTWFVAPFVLLALFWFLLMDSLSSTSAAGWTRVSFVGLLQLYSILNSMQPESLATLLAWMLRGWLQMVVIYVLLCWFARFASQERSSVLTPMLPGNA